MFHNKNNKKTEKKARQNTFAQNQTPFPFSALLVCMHGAKISAQPMHEFQLREMDSAIYTHVQITRLKLEPTSRGKHALVSVHYAK